MIPLPLGAAAGQAAGATGATAAGAGKGGLLSQIPVVKKSTAATAVQLGGIAAAEGTKAAKDYRKDLFKRYGQMQRGDLGMSEAEKAQALAGTQSALQAQQAEQQAMLNQQAAAQGGVRSGATLQQQAQMQAAAAQGLGQAAGQIEAASAQQAQQNAAQTRADLQTQYAHNVDTYQKAANAITNPNMHREVDPRTGKDSTGNVTTGISNLEKLRKLVPGSVAATDSSIQ